MAPAGPTTKACAHGQGAALERLTAAIVAKGMSVIARIDHAGAAAKVGLARRPTDLLIFANPRGASR
jgi:uncharacterized protein (DUF302 family)